MAKKKSKKKFSFFSVLTFLSICVGLVVTIFSLSSQHDLRQHASENPSYFRGVNLFGGWQGLYGGQDTFATPAILDYFKERGLNTFRVGFAWVHLQPNLYGALDATYLSKMDTLVVSAKARGQQIAFVPLPGNYNGNPVGSSQVPQAAFNDLWTRLATHYKDESAIWGYDLLNEPNMGDSWNTSIAPSAIAAIRTVDMIHPIIVPTSTGGYGHYWAYHTVGLPMADPANNLIYEAHFYFDSPPNGQYTNGWDVPNNDLNIGVEHATDFVNWCDTNHEKCYVGEYGVPGGWTHGDETCTYGGAFADPRWLTVLDNFLTYLDAHNISGTYWTGGPYGDINSAGPFCDTSGKYVDAPQMGILEKHLGANLIHETLTPTSVPTVQPTRIPTAFPKPFITVDDSISGSDLNQWNYQGSGWNHCKNCNESSPAVTYYNTSQSWDATGNDTTSISFIGTQIKVYGVVGAWHGMAAVSIDNGPETLVDFYAPVKQGNVLLYTSSQLALRKHILKVRITGQKNSASSGFVIPLDRADIISGVMVTPSQQPTPQPTKVVPTVTPIPTPFVANVPILLSQNLSFPDKTAELVADAKATNGVALHVTQNATVTGTIIGAFRKLTIRAKGDICFGPPHINVKIDGTYIFDNAISSVDYTDYVTNDFSYIQLKDTPHTVEIMYNNDGDYGICDRNVYIDKITGE